MATTLRGPALTILGRQGSGKGTQAERLSEHLGTVHLSTGDLLRAAVAEGSALGRRVARDLEAGRLVSDAILLDVVTVALAGAGVRRRGFVLDGYPRTAEQGDDLIELLGPTGLDAAILLDVPLARSARRLEARRVCPVCGAITSAPEGVETVPCPNGHGAMVRRPDDTPEAIERRLAAYEAQTSPLLQMFRDARRARHGGRHRHGRRGVREPPQVARPRAVGPRLGRGLSRSATLDRHATATFSAS